MLVQQRPSWTCGNPRCYESITFGRYCATCIKLVTSRKLPDSIICEGCGTEVRVRSTTTELKHKQRYCPSCRLIHDRSRSLNYYHAVTKKRRENDDSFLQSKNKYNKDYYYAVTREKNKRKFMEGNV